MNRYMTKPDLIQLARAGDATAIATLMNATLQAIGITARVTLAEADLYVLLESERAVAERSAIEFVCQGMARLGIGWLSSIVVYSRLIGHSAPIWIQKIDFSHAPITNPLVAPVPATLTLPLSIRAFSQLTWPRVRLINLLLLTVPLLVLLNAGHIWNRYLTGTPTLKAARVSFPVGNRQFSQADNPAVSDDPFQAAMRLANRAVVQS